MNLVGILLSFLYRRVDFSTLYFIILFFILNYQFLSSYFTIIKPP
nr:MAG TPA: hypothetical protein [Caudoviricetes sp.]DAV95158.1 MAG TPA: hypothetical protein [Caudoviricetes sp.]